MRERRGGETGGGERGGGERDRLIVTQTDGCG